MLKICLIPFHVSGCGQAESGTDGDERDAGAMFKMTDDPRITKVGKFIRKYSIDELLLKTIAVCIKGSGAK